MNTREVVMWSMQVISVCSSPSPTVPELSANPVIHCSMTPSPPALTPRSQTTSPVPFSSRMNSPSVLSMVSPSVWSPGGVSCPELPPDPEVPSSGAHAASARKDAHSTNTQSKSPDTFRYNFKTFLFISGILPSDGAFRPFAINFFQNQRLLSGIRRQYRPAVRPCTRRRPAAAIYNGIIIYDFERRRNALFLCSCKKYTFTCIRL